MSQLGPFQYYMQAATASDIFPQTQCLGVGCIRLNTLEASDVIMSWVRLFSIPIKSQGVGCVQLNAWEQESLQCTTSFKYNIINEHYAHENMLSVTGSVSKAIVVDSS